MNPEYFASLIRFVLLVAGGFWIFAGLLTWLLRRVVEDGDTFVFWLVFNNPYISSHKGRLEHAIFVSRILLLFGIPTLFVAVILPDPTLQEYGPLGILFVIFGALSLKLIFTADAQDREARYSREDDSEVEAERVRQLEEEGKLGD